MSDALRTKLEELSLMLVMASPDDVQGFGLLTSILKEIAACAQGNADCARIVSAAEDTAKREQEPGFYDRLQRFVSAATALLEKSGTPVFPNEGNEIMEGAKTLHHEQLDQIDPRFLTEFIETHLLSLEEFEGQLADVIREQANADSDTAIKRYLHNVKGDAGSIGLHGVERVCHMLEDAMTTRSAKLLLSELSAFRGWLGAALGAFRSGKQEPQSAHEFIETQLSALLQQPIKADEPQVTISAPEAAPNKPSAGTYPLTGEFDVLIEFATEAEEHLSNVEGVILEAEGNYSKDAIDTIFRGVHSIKGGSAYFSILEMTTCSHILENFLSEVRDGSRVLDQRLNELLLQYIDLQKGVLQRARAAVKANGTMQRDPASDDFLSALEAYGRGAGNVTPKAEARTVPAAVPPVPESISASAPEPKAAQQSENRGRESGDVRTFVKVDTARLDQLIDSIGEMVIYSSMLIRSCREAMGADPRIMDISQRVEKFSRELQDVGMSMRLVPIKGLFQKMSRLVWDTSKKLGKEVEFHMEGEDTELDRNLIDKLADPLMHMVRNSLDHGIEDPTDRENTGKSRKGTVRLAAFHSGGSIHIQIEDDGKGLDPEKLIAKAIEKGVLAAGQKLSEEEAFQLIFAPGFSTAAKVTDISGRGVGMDVVRRNVEALRGRIRIQSTLGKGSRFTIELPLTLAIVDGVQVRVGSEHFIIPSLSVVEFIRPTEQMITHTLDRCETFEFRSRYLPLFRLSDLYGIPSRCANLTEGTVAVVDVNQQQVALLVDAIDGQYSTVIKSLGATFGDAKGLAGCAIMADGEVALILDLQSLLELARNDYKQPTVTPSAEISAPSSMVH